MEFGPQRNGRPELNFAIRGEIQIRPNIQAFGDVVYGDVRNLKEKESSELPIAPEIRVRKD
jgi:hypothetical protein